MNPIAVLKHLQKSRFLRGLILPLALLSVWELLSQRNASYAYAFVPVGRIFEGLPQLVLSGELFVNMAATLARMSSGLLIGSVAGIAIGSLMAVSRAADRLIGPLYHSIRQVPLLGWIPLIGLWFGNGEFSKLLMISLSAFYPMVLNTVEGLRSVENKYIEVGHVLQFNRRQLFLHVSLPAALPSIFTGLSHALAFSWVTAVGTELLFTSGAGIGNLMVIAGESSRMEVIVICVASIGILGFSMNYLFGLFAQRLLRWRNTR